MVESGRILIVDDEAPNVRLMEEILSRAGYACVLGVTDARVVLEAFEEFRPDLVVLDLHMPHLDGFTIMQQLRKRLAPDSFLPILVLTGDISPAVRKRALSSGAKDFVNKPLDAGEILLRIRNLLETRLLHLEIQGQKAVLEDKVRERTSELEHARLETLERLARAAEYRDYDTGLHAQRVGEVAAMVARELGVGEEEAELVRQAGPLHDIGKIGISDTILLKPDRLTPAEFELMKAHAAIGGGMLAGSQSPVLRLAETIARYHHERWDGRGYGGLKGQDIPLVARVVTVVDVFDGLTHSRPYRPPWSREQASAYIRDGSGTAFDPGVVDAFLRVLPSIPEDFFSDRTPPLSADAGLQDRLGPTRSRRRR